MNPDLEKTRSLPRQPAEAPTIYTMPATPDGMGEVVVSVNGRILETRIVGRHSTRDDLARVLIALEAAIRRCC